MMLIFLKMKKIINSYKFHLNEKLTTLFSEEENPNYNILAEFNFYMNNQEDIFIRSYKKIEDIRKYYWNIKNNIINFRRNEYFKF